MKRCLYSILFSILLLGVLSPQTVFASQVYGHLYFANLMLETKSGKYIALQDSTRNAFYGGSIAPDAAWIAHMITNPTIHERLRCKYGVKFPDNLNPVSSQFDDVHQLQPTQLSLQLLAAANSEEERSFAIGWLSHYVVDSFIHDLINQHGGYVLDPTQFDDPAMKMHDRLEALEMRHVLELRGNALRSISQELQNATLPATFLRTTLNKAYPGNSFYKNHSQYFLRTFHVASELMIDSTRWYGYQSEHSPAQIARMKRLIRRFRPKVGKVLEVLTDLPSLKDYRQNLVQGNFISDWTLRSEALQKSSRFLMDNCAAYYWWKDRPTPLGPEMSASALSHIENEMRRINPADDLMQPRPSRQKIPNQ